MTDRDPSDAELAARLRDLGAAIAPIDVDLVERVTEAIATPPARPRRSLVAAAVAALVIVALTLAVTPARSAVAGWLGIGNTRIDVVDDLPTPVSAPPPTTIPDELPADTPLPAEHLVGPLVARFERDLGGASELVLVYDEVSLSITPLSSSILARKAVGDPEAVSGAVTTDGEPALWVEGPHTRSIGAITENVDGSALIWVRDGQELRLTGAITKARAIAIAESVE